MEEQKNDLDALWRYQIRLAQLSPDSSKAPIIRFKNYSREVTIDEYLDEIYVCRDEGSFETNIAQEIDDSSRILCIAGERGSGKTSAVEWVFRYFSNNYKDIFFEKIDIKRIYDSFKISLPKNNNREDSACEIENAFKMFLINYLRQILFSDPHSYKTFISWTLSGSPDKSEFFEKSITTDFLSISFDIAALVKCESDQRTLKRAKIINYFNENPNEYITYKNKVEEILRIPHLIQGYLKLNSSTKQIIIVLDNVDRIPSEIQPHFISVCRDFQLNSGNISACAICIRIENTKGLQSSLPGDEQLIDLIMPDNDKYPAILLPSIGGKLAEKILNRRIEFAIKFLKEYDEKEKTNWRIEFENKIIPYIKPIGKELLSNNIHMVCNGSLRIFLNVYIGFMRYIWTLTRRDMTDYQELFSSPKNHLQTLLYLYLSSSESKEELHIQNIIVLDENPKARTFAEAISPRYLLLTTIYNLTESYINNRLLNVFPPWNVVSQRMSSLGYTHNVLINVLREFIAPVGAPAKILRFQNRELDIKDIHEDSNEPIMLTDQGKEILLKVVEKSGFIYGLAIKRITNRKSKSYFDYSVPERANFIYNFTKKIAKYHLIALRLLKKDWYPNYGESWIIKYREFFGLQGYLQSERILNSSASFFSHLFSNNIDEGNAFYLLCKNYTFLVNKMQNNEFTEEELKLLDEADDLINKFLVIKQ